MPRPPKALPKPYAPVPGEVASEAKRLGFVLAKPQAEALSRYLTLLIKWNRAMNLVGRATWPDVFRDLAADSLYLAEFLAAQGLPDAPLTLDLGAGAGLPGIPLRVMWTAGDYVLVELREKRAIFMRQAIGEMKLARTVVAHCRAEAVAPELLRLGLRERADLVVSRAFLPWPKMLPLAAELLAPEGRLVVLANEPPPPGPDSVGGGFTVTDSREYPSGAKRRYFWSLTPAKA